MSVAFFKFCRKMMKEGDVHVRRFLDIPETLSKLEFLKFNQQLMS